MAVEGAQAQRFIKELRTNTLRGTNAKIEKGIAPILAYPGYRNCKEKPQGLRDIETEPSQYNLWQEIFRLASIGIHTVEALHAKALEIGIQNRSLTKPISRPLFIKSYMTRYFIQEGLDIKEQFIPVFIRE
jgi:hypothetical protein